MRGLAATRRLALPAALACVGALVGAAPAAALKVTWMAGYKAPGTPAKYDKVGVIKVGSPAARNVLVLEPGTSAGSAYFVPLAEVDRVHRAGLAGVVRASGARTCSRTSR